MRDDRSRWPEALGDKRHDLVHKDVTLSALLISRQTVMSGKIPDCLLVSGCKIAIGGGPEVARGETYCLRQRRDRILVVNGPALDDGWRSDHDVAVSDLTSAYSVIEMSGARVENLISTGTEFAGDRPSASVSRLWHGFGVLLYRHGRRDCFRMHVQSPLLDSVWEMLERQVSSLSDLWREEDTASRF